MGLYFPHYGFDRFWYYIDLMHLSYFIRLTSKRGFLCVCMYFDCEVDLTFYSLPFLPFFFFYWLNSFRPILYRLSDLLICRLTNCMYVLNVRGT